MPDEGERNVRPRLDDNQVQEPPQLQAPEVADPFEGEEDFFLTAKNLLKLKTLCKVLV